MITVQLKKNQVPAHLQRLLADYKGRKFRAYVVDKMTIPMTAGLWEGGSQDTFSVYMGSQVRVTPFDQNAAPFDAQRKDTSIRLEFGTVVVRRSFFCGKDIGFTYYVNAATLKSTFGVDAPAE